jgi:hypothetical protein
MFTTDNQACSIECDSWFPPMKDYTQEYDKDLYKDWLIGKPIHLDDLEYQDNNDDILCNIQ